MSVIGEIGAFRVLESVSSSLVRNFGPTTVTTISDASELFQDAFDDFDSKPTDLLPKKATLEKGQVEIPAIDSTYDWETLPSERMIRLVEFPTDPEPFDSKTVRCGLMHTKAPTTKVSCKIKSVS